MVITLPPNLSELLAAFASQRGIAPELLAVEVLQQQLDPIPKQEPRDDWERRLFALTFDAGVSLSDRDVSSEGVYD